MKEIVDSLREHIRPGKKEALSRFFKTGPGEYGEGDKFLGVMVPDSRKVVREYSKKVGLTEVDEILSSVFHEVRLTGVLILVDKFKKGNKEVKKEIYEFYLKHANRINNWDLVDLSAPNIVGNYLLDKKDKGILDKLAKSKNLWEKRISIISTAAFIRAGEFKDCLRMSKMLLKDKHDLMHKAVGWMLREVGKKDSGVLRKFLKENYTNLPRTTLRYAIEKFSEKERKNWLKGVY